MTRTTALAVAKPDACASCGAPLEQGATGRPREYCSSSCRRLAERKIRVAEQMLARARREEQKYRARAEMWGGTTGKSEARWWAAEVERCEAELAELLGIGSEDAEDTGASAAAATLARRRRG